LSFISLGVKSVELAFRSASAAIDGEAMLVPLLEAGKNIYGILVFTNQS
jgi:hypothetical protein